MQSNRSGVTPRGPKRNARGTLLVAAIALGFGAMPLTGCSTLSSAGNVIGQGWDSITSGVGNAVDSVTPSSRGSGDADSGGGSSVYRSDYGGGRSSSPGGNGTGAFQTP